MPWQSGLTGIAYNAKLTKEVRSFDELLTRPDLKGKVSLLSEMHDTMLFMLLWRAPTPRTSTRTSSPAAIDRLEKATDAGQMRTFTGNEYAHDLVKGDIVACDRLVRRRHPAAVRQPGHQVRRSRGGPDPLERQHAGAEQGRPQGRTPRS